MLSYMEKENRGIINSKFLKWRGWVMQAAQYSPKCPYKKRTGRPEKAKMEIR